ncbi:MAG: hypothetical protein C4326_10640 [Ignavibacteria bacterium]
MNVLVFGVDGGGTKTTGLLADERGTVLSERTGGATNVHVVGVEAAASRLALVLTQCCAAAGCTLGDVRALVLGLAGAGREEVRWHLSEQLTTLLGSPLPLMIETDARVALEGAFGGKHGIVIIAGTGSVVIGKSPNGAVALLGGWGRALGDGGSGYFLGIEALKVLAALLDGRVAPSPLTRLTMEVLQRETRESLLDLLYRERYDPAQLAPVVLRAMHEGDDRAAEILRRGAVALADQARALAERLQFESDIPTVLHGGVMQTEYARMVSEELRKFLPAARVQAPEHSPAYGAVLLALRYLRN